jgi:gas vesicle protein|tara:strand:- start:130 stop:486 length:357 start_codon:yes stop_codon:yes gene_type:complete
MKRSELAEYIKETIIDVLSEATPEEVAAQKELNKELEKTIELSKELSEDIDDDDVEPTAKDIAKGDSVSIISRKLQDITKEMKSVVRKWKKSEGEEKERLLARLKELTKIKKELEGLI